LSNQRIVRQGQGKERGMEGWLEAMMSQSMAQHEAIKLNYKKKLACHVIVVLRVPSTMHDTRMANTDVIGHHTQGQTSIRLVS
jgi:hypothetical protein